MQSVQAVLISIGRWFRGGLLPLCFVFIAALFCAAGSIQASSETPGIIYTRSGSNPFSAILEQDEESELFPVDESLAAISIDGETVPFEFADGPQGQMKITGRLPALSAGKHDATIEIYSPDRQRIDGRQLLLLVDSTPPEIELVEPRGALPRTSTSLLFSVKDPEGGSGVAVEPDTAELQVEATGADVFSKAFVLRNDALHLIVTVTFPQRIAPPDYRFSLVVSLKDRAGNPGRFSGEFKTAGLIQPEFIRLCQEDDTSILSTLGFLVYPKEKGLQLQRGESRALSFYTYGNYGKDYTYPAICANDYGKSAPEFSELSKFFQEEIGRRIEIISSPQNIIVERLTDHDLTDHRVTFDVRQTSAVSMGDQMASLQVRIPVSFSLDKAINYCPFDDYARIPDSAFTFTYETMTIPLVQDVAGQPVKMRILQEGDQLVSQVQFDSVELMDRAASWFEIEGEKHWYGVQGDMCTARGPVSEGTVHYRVAAVHTFAVFQDVGNGGGADGRTFYNAGDIIVKLAPPVISGFSYDRQANTLYANITDEGTRPGDLDIKLGLPGYNLDFDFNTGNGELKAVLDFTPESVVEASLQVTDRAGQRTSASCKIFGNPDTPATLPAERVTATYAQTGPTRNITGANVIGTAGNGLHLVKVCSDKSLHWGFYNKGKFVAVNPGSVTLVRLRARDSARSRFPAAAPSGNSGNTGIEVFYNHYDTSLYEPVPGAGASAKISMTGGFTPSAAGRQKLYYVTGYYKDGRFIPTNYNIGLGFTTRATQDCRVEKRDISSPVVQAAYDPASGLVTGRIHDSGQPLSQLKIRYTAQNDSKNAHFLRETMPFTFKAGQFSARFEPPARGEFFVLEIRAADLAGNVGLATMQATIPRSPPEVSIQVETETSQLLFSHNLKDINTYVTAEAVDDSEIITGGTTFWMDGQSLAQFSHPDTKPYQGRSSAFTRNAFNYRGLYAAQIGEGPHTARFRATDAAGLSAETTRQFEFNLVPIIRDLKVMPGAVLRAGGPVFTALILDRGGDLGINGLSVTIDGNAVDMDRLFYDPASGYFAVEGPLDLADGRHTVQLTAVDSRGNRAAASLQFVRQLQVMLVPGPEDGVDLNIDTVSLMELRDHNGDGQANPGELVRVFVSLRNDSQYDRDECRGALSTGNENISVETGRVIYGRIESGAVSVPLKGFDLQIDRDTLSDVVRDPYEIHFDLAVNCGTGHEQRLPLVLPVYRSSVPVDISSAVNVELDRLPATTTSAAFPVRGEATSSGAFLDSVVVRVNGVAVPASFNRDGGRFEAAVPLAEGPNVIEVEASDQTGARGYASGYIHRAPAFVPPEIAITSPAEGAFYQCGTLTVSGTYNPGSSTLDHITVIAPRLEGYGECPVTIVDGSHFTANCGEIIMFGGVYNIGATLDTTQGTHVSTLRSIIVGDCF